MKRLLFLLTALPCATLFAQIKIGGTGTPKASAVLEVDGGGTKGMLIPQVTQAQRTTSITNPAQGLLVYQTDGVVGFYVNRSSIPSTPNWSMLSEGGSYWTSANSSPNDIANVNSGNVGIGTFAPMRGGLVVDKKVGAINAIFGSSTTGIAIESSYPGIGFNTYYNAGRRYMTSGFGGYVGVDPLAGQFNIFMSDSNSTVFGGNATTDRLRLRILKNGFIGIQGNDNPQAPLSFAAITGKKISLYRGTTGDAGFGVYGNELRMTSDYNGADITFGYDNLTNGFTENLRIKANGNTGVGTNAPAYKLDVNGRVRLRHNGITSGIWFNNSTNVETAFTGMYTDTKFGIYGPTGWQFAIDGADGTVYCGTANLDNETLAKGVGYKLKVFGKILAEEVRVQLKAAWPDYVFGKDYELASLETVEHFIKTNNHLPNVPAAAEVEKSGIALGEMQSKMMEKIEELTLYLIEANKKIAGLQKEIDQIKNKQ